MTAHFSCQSRILYFCCPTCGRWVSSAYSDIFRSDAKVRVQASARHTTSPCFEAAKEKLERWLAALDGQDPYRVMGVSPLDSSETIRNRYRELALERHPDRGGSPSEMQELNHAYERISRHRQGADGDGESLRSPASEALPAKAG
jgi:hypothetical protein